MHRTAPRIFDGEILVFHFDAYLELLVRQQNWHSGALGEPPFPAAISGIFLFEKPIHRPLDVFTEVLRQQETKLICIRYFGRTALFLFFSREAVAGLPHDEWCRRQTCTQRTELGSAESCSNQRARNGLRG